MNFGECKTLIPTTKFSSDDESRSLNHAVGYSVIFAQCLSATNKLFSHTDTPILACQTKMIQMKYEPSSPGRYVSRDGTHT